MSSERRKVLVVDDEEDLVAMLALRLRSTGRFEVASALDASQALERAADFEPDVILLDGVMPGIDGWELSRRLRKTPAGARAAIVLMTAGTPRGSRRRAESEPVDALVLKPFDDRELIALLSQARPRGAGSP